MIPRFRLIAALPIALAASLFLYGNLLFRAEPLERDDQSLVTPLESVHGPADYYNAWAAGKILDVAPVRDLSFALDLAASKAAGKPTFTATNVLLWLVFVALALSLARALELGDCALWCLLIVLIAHPAYAVSVAWISARKHLLAGVFALAATLSLVKRPRYTAPFYALSLLSHPIHLLWPVFAAVYARLSRASVKLWPSWVLFVFFGALNAWYYAGPYQAATGIGKFAASGGPATACLAFGRALINLVLPLALSPVDYFPGSAWSIAGLALFPVLAFVFAKRLPREKFLPWALFFCLPLVLLNVRSTRVFLSDTYLLIPSLGLWILLLELARAWKPKAILLSAILCAPFGLYASHALAASFLSMETLFNLAFQREATPQVQAVQSKHLYEEGRLREAAELSFAAIPDFPPAEIIFSQAVAMDPMLSADQKLALLAKAPGHEPVARYFKAVVLLQANHDTEAYDLLAPLLPNVRSLGEMAREVAELAYITGMKAHRLSPADEASLKGLIAALSVGAP